MKHTCQFWVLDETTRETPCGKPAVAHITWGYGLIYKAWQAYWYCAEHYDKRIAYIRECGRLDVLKANGVK